MVRVVLALMLCLAVLPDRAGAGAWPREAGKVFVSTDIRLSRPRSDLRFGAQRVYRTLYFEYGLTDRLTVGLDLGRSVSGADKTVVFARYPIPLAQEQNKLAVTLGLGTVGSSQMVRPGVSYGRAVHVSRDVFGWIAVDGIAEVDRLRGTIDYKLDATFGVTLPSRTKLMVQLQTGAPHDRDAFLRIEPSIVWPMGKTGHVEFGTSIGLRGDDQLGIKLGMWQQF